MVIRYNKNYKKKKKYSTTERTLYKTGKFLGEAGRGIKEGLKKGYSVASSPKTQRFFKGARQEIATELQETPIQQTIEEERLRERIRNLEFKNRMMEKRPQRRMINPFTKVAAEHSPSNQLNLGWGGF